MVRTEEATALEDVGWFHVQVGVLLLVDFLRQAVTHLGPALDVGGSQTWSGDKWNSDFEAGCNFSLVWETRVVLGSQPRL